MRQTTELIVDVDALQKDLLKDADLRQSSSALHYYPVEDEFGLEGLLGAEGFEGEIAYSYGLDAYYIPALAKAQPSEDERGNEKRWPWASVTKQLIAIAVMVQVEAGKLNLDSPISNYVEWPHEGVAPSLRQVLQHQSGFRNPDTSPADPSGFPSAYASGLVTPSWCMQVASAPPTNSWEYNNCDYVVVGEILERVSGLDLYSLLARDVVDQGILTWDAIDANDNLDPAKVPSRALSFPPHRNDIEYTGSHDRTTSILSGYGAAGGIIGPLSLLIEVDVTLMKGWIISDESLAELWKPSPELGGMALGQWVYDYKLAGCDKPVRIVERRGAILHYQMRNFIVPDKYFVLVMATDQADFDFGEVWQGQGPSHDVLSTALCNK